MDGGVSTRVDFKEFINKYVPGRKEEGLTSIILNVITDTLQKSPSDEQLCFWVALVTEITSRYNVKPIPLLNFLLENKTFVVNVSDKVATNLNDVIVTLADERFLYIPNDSNYWIDIKAWNLIEQDYVPNPTVLHSINVSNVILYFCTQNDIKAD